MNEDTAFSGKGFWIKSGPIEIDVDELDAWEQAERIDGEQTSIDTSLDIDALIDTAELSKFEITTDVDIEPDTPLEEIEDDALATDMELLDSDLSQLEFEEVESIAKAADNIPDLNIDQRLLMEEDLQSKIDAGIDNIDIALEGMPPSNEALASATNEGALSSNSVELQQELSSIKAEIRQLREELRVMQRRSQRQSPLQANEALPDASLEAIPDAAPLPPIDEALPDIAPDIAPDATIDDLGQPTGSFADEDEALPDASLEAIPDAAPLPPIDEALPDIAPDIAPDAAIDDLGQPTGSFADEDEALPDASLEAIPDAAPLPPIDEALPDIAPDIAPDAAIDDLGQPTGFFADEDEALPDASLEAIPDAAPLPPIDEALPDIAPDIAPDATIDDLGQPTGSFADEDEALPDASLEAIPDAAPLPPIDEALPDIAPDIAPDVAIDDLGQPTGFFADEDEALPDASLEAIPDAAPLPPIDEAIPDAAPLQPIDEALPDIAPDVAIDDLGQPTGSFADEDEALPDASLEAIPDAAPLQPIDEALPDIAPDAAIDDLGQPTGFFSDDEDETIALTDDELDSVVADTAFLPDAMDMVEELIPVDIEEESTAGQTVTPSVASAPSGEGPSDDDYRLSNIRREELRALVSYMDKLLKDMPEQRVEEFAHSHYFNLYRRLFTDLDLEH